MKRLKIIHHNVSQIKLYQMVSCLSLCMFHSVSNYQKSLALFFRTPDTRYPGGPWGTTPRGKNPQNDFFLFKFFSQLILWVNTRWLTPRLSFYHKKWLRYGFLKFWGYPRGAKFQTPVKPKIWVREQKYSGFLNNSPRTTFTPKKSKFYFLRVFSFTDLSWNHPIQVTIICPWTLLVSSLLLG